MTQLGLLSYSAPVTSEKAPDGVQRAARAGSRVDLAVMKVCRDNIGRDVTEGDFWAAVTARATCVPDTARRRRDALRDQGLLAYERPATGVIRVTWVQGA